MVVPQGIAHTDLHWFYLEEQPFLPLWSLSFPSYLSSERNRDQENAGKQNVTEINAQSC